MAYVNLQDIIDNKEDEPEEYAMWQEAIQAQTGDTLEEFAKKCSYSLVPEDEFEAYTQETCVDIGDIREGSALFWYVDWERAADNLKMDYSTIEVNGTTYYYR